MKFPQTGNKIWFNRAFLYYHRCRDDPLFVGEMYWIMKEIGVIPQKTSSEENKP